MAIIYLGADHPYVKNFYVYVFQEKNGKYGLVWKDFDGVKQEMNADTYDDALKIAHLLKKFSGLIDMSYIGCRFENNNIFWHSF